MLGDVHLLPGRFLRHPWRWQRPGVPSSRERDRPERGRDRQALRQVLAALRDDHHQRREDVQVAGQFLHHPRSAGEISPRSGALPADRQPLPQSDQLLGGEPARGQGGPGPFLQRAQGAARGGAGGSGGVCRALRRGDGRRLQYRGCLLGAVRAGAGGQSSARKRPVGGGCAGRAPEAVGWPAGGAAAGAGSLPAGGRRGQGRCGRGRGADPGAPGSAPRPRPHRPCPRRPPAGRLPAPAAAPPAGQPTASGARPAQPPPTGRFRADD